MKILNFGSCNIDYVYSVDHFIKPGETLGATELNIFPGGKGLNQSVAIARAGGEVYHAGCIGTDGLFLKETLESAGADTSLINVTDGKTGHAVIELTPDGENRIMIYSGANCAVTEDYADRVLSHFGDGDILVLQNEISCRRYITAKARERGMRIIFNAAPFDAGIAREDLSAVSYLALNKTEAAGLSGTDSHPAAVEVLRKKYPDTGLILTLGSEGCRYTDGNTDVFQKAFSVKAVDTTAAGDTFIGYFAAGLARGEDMSVILEVCCRASALCVTRLGASSSVPTLEEVKKTDLKNK